MLLNLAGIKRQVEEMDSLILAPSRNPKGLTLHCQINGGGGGTLADF